MDDNRDSKGRFKKGSYGFNQKHTEASLKRMSDSQLERWNGHRLRVTRICKKCMKLFKVWPSYEKRSGGDFCSKECFKSFSTKKSFRCNNCNKVIWLYPYKFSRKYHFCSNKCRNIFTVGEKSHCWVGGNRITRDRHLLEVDIWHAKVLERDNYTRQLCGKKGVQFQVHHILPYRFCVNNGFPEYKNDVENGISLCKTCHQLMANKEYLYIPKFLNI
jgi:hypothetical protein